MGGTIAALVSWGHDVVLVDLTDGEPTPHGDPETRARESAKAAEILGVQRIQAGLKNREIVHDIASRHRIAGIIREFQADVLFVPHGLDAHPDHVACTRIVEDARFDAKLTKTDLPGEPIYPRWLFYYYCTHLRRVPDPTFLVDITGFEEQKRQAMLAYESQFVVPERNRRVIDWIMAGATFFGSRIGTAAAEPFSSREPLGIRGLSDIVGLGGAGN